MGPFGAKNLGTTISPWVVTMEALEPFKIPNMIQDPTPFPYLQHDDSCNFDIKLEVDIKRELIFSYRFFVNDLYLLFLLTSFFISVGYDCDFVFAAPSGVVTTVCRSNFKYMYWTPRQQLAHHTITGCNINPGDLMGSGTISGEVRLKFHCF